MSYIPSYDYWRDQAKEARTEYALANQLKDEFEEAAPELKGFWADLMGAALSEVDWHEVAKHYWDETREETEE